MELGKMLGDAVLSTLRKAGLLKEEQRAIKDVDEWDGSASRWESTEEYCNACLINVNQEAGNSSPEDWTQALCMLPVREPGDSEGTYVRQAVHAAAGGRGITRVEKPSDVSQEDWDTALTAAANKIISAYGEMEETAPDSVYEIAGKEPPMEERAITVDMLWGIVAEKVYDLYPNAWLMDVFTSSSETYGVIAMDGGLYKVPVTISDDDEVGLADMEKVKTEHVPAGEDMGMRGFYVRRQADGQLRWVSVSCTAILNRVGEIDSTALFDSFVDNVERTGEYPQLDFWHVDGTDMGQADFVARDGFVLITSGLFYDDELGRAAAEGLAADPEYWGTSILYAPTAQPEEVDISGVKIPVYNKGVLRKVTILPERSAAANFTNIIKRSKIMNKKVKDDLLRLVQGDEELADNVEQRVDGVNRAAESGDVVARDKEEQGQEEEPKATVTPLRDMREEAASEEEGEKLRDTLSGIVETINTLSATVEAVGSQLLELAQKTDVRFQSLERSDKERKHAWLSDLPELLAVPIHRPRQVKDEEGEEPSTADRVSTALKDKGLEV